MSWSKNVSGRRQAVIDACSSDDKLPDGVKSLIATALSVPPGGLPDQEAGFNVETYGHVDSNGGDALVKIRRSVLVAALLLGLMLASTIAAPALAAAAPPVPPSQPGDTETVIFGVAWRDQATSQWVGTVNVALATYTGQTTEAGVATTMFRFGENSGIGAGGFVEQEFWSSTGGWTIYGTMALEAVGGSAGQSTNGIGSAALGVKHRTLKAITPRVMFFAQTPVGSKGSGNSAADSLNQIGVLFGLGFGKAKAAPVPGT